MTTGAADILEALAPLREPDLFAGPVGADEPPREDVTLPPNDDDRCRIASALGPTPVEIDEIIRHTELPAASVYLVLLELDLAGRLHRHPGGLVSIATD